MLYDGVFDMQGGQWSIWQTGIKMNGLEEWAMLSWVGLILQVEHCFYIYTHKHWHFTPVPVSLLHSGNWVWISGCLAGISKSHMLNSLWYFSSDLGEVSLKIIGVTSEDDGIYTCIAANDMGSVSSSASLRVLGEFIFVVRVCKLKDSNAFVKLNAWCKFFFAPF